MSRKSTASTTISKLIKQEKEEDEEKMRQGLEGMLEKKTYIGLVRPDPLWCAAGKIRCSNSGDRRGDTRRPVDEKVDY